MSDAIKRLHDYLAKSPSVVYPEDVLAYLPAIEDENAKLRQELEVVGTAAYLYGRTDLADENAKLREERDHWHVEQIHAYGNWEDACRRAVELDAENAKLRELARLLLYGTTHDAEPAEGLVWSQKVNALVRELGIEVDEWAGQ